MASEVEVAGGADEPDVAEESAAGVPARVAWLAGVGHDGYDVVLAKAQLVSDVDLEAHVAIVRAADELAVEIDVGHIHDAAKVEQQPTAAQLVGRGRQMETIPGTAHLLEATAGETALDVGRHIAVVGLLVSRRRHPGLLYLEVVGHVDDAPCGVVVGGGSSALDVAGMEAPAEVQVLRCAGLGGQGGEVGTGRHQGQRCKEDDSFDCHSRCVLFCVCFYLII